MEDHPDMLHQLPKWTKLCRLEGFGQNENITAEGIKYKVGNMKKTFSKLHNEFRGGAEFGITEGDCDSTVADK